MRSRTHARDLGLSHLSKGATSARSMDGALFQKRGCGTPTLRAPTIPNKRLSDSSDQSEAVLAQRGRDASSPRLLDNKGPRRIALLDSPLPNQPIIACTPSPVQSTLPSCSQAKRPLSNPASAGRLGAPSLALGRFIHAMRTWQAALFAPPDGESFRGEPNSRLAYRC